MPPFAVADFINKRFYKSGCGRSLNEKKVGKRRKSPRVLDYKSGDECGDLVPKD